MNATMAIDGAVPSTPLHGMTQSKGAGGNAGNNAYKDTLASTKPLWAVIGILGISVLAMGATLVHIKQRPAEPVAASTLPSLNYFALQQPSEVSSGAGSDGMVTETAAQQLEPRASTAAATGVEPVANKLPIVPAKSAAKPKLETKAQKNAATQKSASDPTPVPVVQAAVALPVAQAKPVCANCGEVEAVTPVLREGQGSAVGVIGGGVVGAVLGNQVGKGSGRTAATILGAVGGGWAGNKIEKNIKKETIYAVRVRMQDGSSRTLEQASAPAVGAKVTVDGNTLRTSDGAAYAPAAANRRAQANQVAQPARMPQQEGKG